MNPLKMSQSEANLHTVREADTSAIEKSNYVDKSKMIKSPMLNAANSPDQVIMEEGLPEPMESYFTLEGLQ